jgi:hypothetical protein
MLIKSSSPNLLHSNCIVPRPHNCQEMRGGGWEAGELKWDGILRARSENITGQSEIFSRSDRGAPFALAPEPPPHDEMHESDDITKIISTPGHPTANFYPDSNRQRHQEGRRPLSLSGMRSIGKRGQGREADGSTNLLLAEGE